jgi:membrane fusion protein, multidrug efflux system
LTTGFSSILNVNYLAIFRMFTMRSLLCAASFAVLLAACSKVEPLPEPIRAVRTVTVAAQNSDGALEYSGEVRARSESGLGFRVGGKVVRREVSLGDHVKAGQVLARLDPQDLRLGQDAARAAVAAAQANLDQTAADYKRFEALRQQNFISSAELERRSTALKAAQAQVAQARAQSGVQSNQASYAMLVAPSAGVITAVDAEPGQVVSAGAPVLRLAHDGPRDVVFAVAEDKADLIRNVAGLAAGQHASGAASVPVSSAGSLFQVKLWGQNDWLDAQWREMAAAADPATRTFAVKVALGRAEAVKLGQTATVKLNVPVSQAQIRVPLSALREEHGRTTVWRVDPQKMTLQSQAVQVAGSHGQEAVISTGLAAGETIVTAGVHVLNAGQKVRFYAEPKTTAASNLGSVPTPVTAR